MYFVKSIKSPLGKIELVATDDALVALYTTEDENKPLLPKAKRVTKHLVLCSVEKQLDEYFRGQRTDFTISVKPAGTEFQSSAWNALQKIPFGKVWSYGEQAKFLKKPKAQRAVGGANGKNPIPIIIPCHRVVGATGKLTGFSGGMKMKVYLLKLEGHEIDLHGLKLI